MTRFRRGALLRSWVIQLPIPQWGDGWAAVSSRAGALHLPPTHTHTQTHTQKFNRWWRIKVEWVGEPDSDLSLVKPATSKINQLLPLLRALDKSSSLSPPLSTYSPCVRRVLWRHGYDAMTLFFFFFFWRGGKQAREEDITQDQICVSSNLVTFFKKNLG